MPAKVFIDTNIVIYALGPASDKAAVVAPLLVERADNFNPSSH